MNFLISSLAIIINGTSTVMVGHTVFTFAPQVIKKSCQELNSSSSMVGM